MENRVKSYLVGAEHGEIRHEINEGDKVRITRKESTDFLRDTTTIDNGSWIRMFTEPMRMMARSLNTTELSLILYMASYIDYTSGILKHSNGRFLRRACIIRETGYSEKTIDKVLASLKNKQIIGKHKTGREIKYTVNPFIFMKGKRVNKTLYDLYKNTKWARC